MCHTTPSRTRLFCAFLLLCLIFSFILCIMMAIGFRMFPKETASLSTDLPAYTPIFIIDAGHGGEDGGAVGKDGSLEKDINLKIATTLDEMLRSAGYRTVMTRTDDRMLYDRNTDYRGRKKRLDLEARLGIAEQHENAVFISIHLNAFPQTQYSGLQVYYSENHEDSLRLANQIQTDAKAYLQPKNERRVKPSNGTSFLLDSCMHPSVLVECGFLSNPEECQKLASNEYQTALATLLFRSLTEIYRPT